jgi:ribosomal protein S18 acetylase RimI-like enzyme
MTADGIVLDVDDDPTAADVARLDDGLAAFTVAAAGHEPPEPLAVFARNDGVVAGGIHGWTWGSCCELVSLWVSEPLRHRGVGRALLAAAEAAAERRGCRQVVLFTHGVQAPRLYTGTGYQLVGEVEDYPAGSTAYWFRKRLDRQPAAQAQRLLQAALYAGIAALLATEALAGVRSVRRQTTHRFVEMWTRLERNEHRQSRFSQIAFLATHLKPRQPPKRLG